MKNSELVMCPIKETLVHQWVCEEKCTYTREKCAAAMAAFKAGRRHCIDCWHYADDGACGPCLDADPDHRTRPEWVATDDGRTCETVKPKQAGQLSLF